VPQLGVLAGVGDHGLLLLGQRLVGGDGLRGRLGAILRPGLLLEPAVVTAAGHAQGGQRPLRGPATAPPGQLDLGVDPLLQLDRQLAVFL
jgi:hypothetical protein